MGDEHVQSVVGKNVRKKSLPTLFTAAEIEEKIKGLLSAARLTELAEAGYAPHWRIDDGPPLFQVTEVKEYIVEHLSKYNPARPFPEVVEVFVPPPLTTQGVGALPPALHAMTDKLETIYAPRIPPAVYFLCKDNEVVYVGQSTNLLGRLSQHHKDKSFTHVFFLRVPQSELFRVEAAFIRILKPAYNGDRSYLGELSIEHADVLEWMGMSHILSNVANVE